MGSRCYRYFVGLLVVAVLGGVCFGARVRGEVGIPEIPGYAVLKCDFHMHTVFSDGDIWPTVRVEEAWREGLDAISITDHLEYKPHKDDVSVGENRPYELAKARAAELGIILIRGAEITKEVPPGHFNAIFLEDCEPVNDPNYRKAIRKAVRQGGFVFYNHPPFRRPDGKCYWGPEQEGPYEEGLLKGIEVVNGIVGEPGYYPAAHKWAVEKGLTMFANSDQHAPMSFSYDFAAGEHRPMTLVFCKERTAGAIKEALLARRTAVYSGDMVIGDEEFLRSIFEGAVEIVNPEVQIKGRGRTSIGIQNKSGLDFRLVSAGSGAELSVPGEVRLYGGDKTVLLPIRAKGQQAAGIREIALPYKVENMLIGPERPLAVKLNITAEFVSPEGN